MTSSLPQILGFPQRLTRLFPRLRLRQYIIPIAFLFDKPTTLLDTMLYNSPTEICLVRLLRGGPVNLFEIADHLPVAFVAGMVIGFTAASAQNVIVKECVIVNAFGGIGGVHYIGCDRVGGRGWGRHAGLLLDLEEAHLRLLGRNDHLRRKLLS